MVGPQRRILIFTTLLPSLVAGSCHWEPSVFHKTGIKLILYNYFQPDESVFKALDLIWGGVGGAGGWGGGWIGGAF